MDLGEFPEGWLGERAPTDLRDGASIARYGALVRARIGGWFEGAAPAEFERVIRVYYGPQSGHDLLERTTWHAAQHLRQLYVLVERHRLTPPEPLPVDADRKSTRLNSSHVRISYAVFCLNTKNRTPDMRGSASSHVVN